MIYKQFIQKQSIVFSRWSRKSWSLFSALGKQITIGVLSANICDMAYQKMMVVGSFISKFYNTIFTFDSQSFKNSLGQQSILISTFLNALNQVKSVDTIDEILYYQNLKKQRCFIM